MNSLVQTLLRSLLKIGAGYLVAKGFADESTAEIISAGALAAVGVVWGVIQRKKTPALPVKISGQPSAKTAVLMLAMLGSAGAFLAGCSFVKIQDQTRQVAFSAVMPAWPWQDSGRVLERMNLSSKTNAFTASIRGLQDNETTSTNAVDLVSQVVSSAVGAAVSAARPGP